MKKLPKKLERVIVTRKDNSEIPCWMEVKDHGHDIRFYFGNLKNRVLEEYIKDWRYPKRPTNEGEE